MYYNLESMERHHASADADNLAQVGRAALDALRERSRISKFLSNPKVELRESLGELLESVQITDPANWTDEDYEQIEEMMASVIERLERHQMTDGDQDLALCAFMGSAVKALREAQGWIAQGLSPNPAKRPSDQKLRELEALRSAAALRDLYA